MIGTFWREVAVPVLWPVPEAAVTVFSTPDDGCCDTRNMQSDFAVNKYLHTVASGWIFINIELRCTEPWVKNSKTNYRRHCRSSIKLNFLMNTILNCYGCSQILELYHISGNELWKNIFLQYVRVESSWNVMAHGDAREGNWRRNWRMDWVASTLHTTSEHGVSSITTADAAHLGCQQSTELTPTGRFKWTDECSG